MTLDPSGNIIKLNPGIRKTVRWLNWLGYKTCDSGDGTTHACECDQPIPYVHMMVEPNYLNVHAHGLKTYLAQRGVDVQPMNEEGTAPAIEVSYNPCDRFGIMTLWNVKDTDLDFTQKDLDRMDYREDWEP